MNLFKTQEGSYYYNASTRHFPLHLIYVSSPGWHLNSDSHRSRQSMDRTLFNCLNRSTPINITSKNISEIRSSQAIILLHNDIEAINPILKSRQVSN